MKRKSGENQSMLYAKIGGMHCEHCFETVTAALKALDGVTAVSFRRNIAKIEGEPLPSANEIARAIENAGYETDEARISSEFGGVSRGARLLEALAIAAGIVLAALLIRLIFGYNVFNAIPTIDSSLSYGMLFVTGLLCGIHCLSMCGAIGLFASSDEGAERSIKKPLLYNLGRVISYTLFGGAVGAIGRVFSLSPVARGILIVLAALCMLLMALSMLGLIRFRLPRLFGNRRFKGRGGAFLIGLLNAFMPCGPLQAMQLYALSSASFIGGAISMLLFALGTVPVMLASGALINLAKGRARAFVGRLASVLILVLSLSMLVRGLSALGFDAKNLFPKSDEGYIIARVENGVQIVEFDLEYDSYADIVVRKDIPVRLTIRADEEKLTGCNNEVVCGDLGFDAVLHAGENVIEFLPETEGDFIYSCWMNMIINHIKVIDNGE